MDDEHLPHSLNHSPNSDVWRSLAALRESPVDADAGRRRLAAKLAHQERLSHMSVHSPLQRRRGAFSRMRVAGIAVGVLALLAVVGGLEKSRTANGVDPKTIYSTRNGQRAEIVLADDTHVTLNVASRIDIPRNFGEGNRTIHLTGEAYFRVAHERNAPFVVEAGPTRTTVLGTAFGVRAYHPNDVQVAVRDGRVSLNHVVLGARDLADVTNGNRMTVTRNSQELDNIFSFTTGQLVLKDIPLRDAREELERWYNVEIHLADPSIGQLPISLVAADGSVTDLVNVLQPVLNVRVVRSGRILTLYANH